MDNFFLACLTETPKTKIYAYFKYKKTFSYNKYTDK